MSHLELRGENAGVINAASNAKGATWSLSVREKQEQGAAYHTALALVLNSNQHFYPSLPPMESVTWCLILPSQLLCAASQT